LGHGLDATWPRLLDNDVSTLRHRNDLIGRSMLVGQVPDPLPNVPQDLARHACRNNQLSLAALRQIEHDVRATMATVPPERVAVVMGSSTAGMASAEVAVAHLMRHGELPPAFHYTQLEFGGVAEFVADYLGAAGPCYTISTACSSGAKALASARTLLSLGVCDAVVAGGTDSLCKMTAGGFSALKAVTDVPSVPFSRNRKGFVLGEGSAICLLTRAPDGIQLIGTGESSDTHHMSAPHPDGLGAEQAMRAALADASLEPADVDYLNLHGTGTPLNDLAEGKAVHRLFPTHLPCSSTKPLVGHTLGASGAIEAAFCWTALREMRNRQLALLPHYWDGLSDPNIPNLRLVRRGDVAEVRERAVVVSNSFGFGGNNCSLILSARAN
jgi:3-oxoacyl-[acyl-carrier-protein] synthase-1